MSLRGNETFKLVSRYDVHRKKVKRKGALILAAFETRKDLIMIFEKHPASPLPGDCTGYANSTCISKIGHPDKRSLI